MEAASQFIQNFNRQELEEIKRGVEARIADLIANEQKVTLEQQIQLQGYAFRKEEIECQYPHINLRVGVEVSTWDKEDHHPDDWHIDQDLADEQDPWFEHLDFPVESTRFSVDDVEYVNKKWKYGDWNDPAHNTGWVAVYFYFKRQSLPLEGETVSILRNEDRKKRKIRSLVVKDSVVYIDDKPVSSVAEWKEDVMILDE